MTRILSVFLLLCMLPPLSGASEIDEQIRSTCRWIDAEEAIPTPVLEQAVALDADERQTEGVSSACAVVLDCLLEARTGKGKVRDPGSTDVDDAAPESLCWRVVEVERLSKETIDRMLERIDPTEKGADPDPKSCRRFLQCLSDSSLGKPADSSWREEFARICAQTDVADTLSREQLQVLIQDCEKLLGELEQLPEREGKVYIFRLKMCRDLFDYSLQLLGADSTPSD